MSAERHGRPLEASAREAERATGGEQELSPEHAAHPAGAAPTTDAARVADAAPATDAAQSYRAPTPLFAPYEIAVCGYSGAGKSSLIGALLRRFSESYRVGYVKHDAHRFSMDHEGKDTYRAAEAGASTVFINDAERFAYLGSGAIEPRLQPLLFQDVDFVLVEGYRRSKLPKLVVVDRDGAILSEVESGGVRQIAAFVVRADASGAVAERARALAATVDGAPPVLSGEDIPAIAGLVLEHFARRTAAIPLYGVVLGGGRSVRMGRDKAAIDYHGKPQARWAAELLSRFCSRVFVSTRAEQADEPVFAGLEQIHDRFVDIGPLGGILSALHAHPDAAWLVLGCDLPFVTRETLDELVRQRDPFRLATCFEASDGLPEPLCALYEPSYRMRVHQLLGEGRTCPRKSLILSRCKRVAPADARSIENINYPQQREDALTRLADTGA